MFREICLNFTNMALRLGVFVLKATTNFLESVLMAVAGFTVLAWLYLSLSANERREVKLFVDDIDAVRLGKYDYPKRTTEVIPESQR